MGQSDPVGPKAQTSSKVTRKRTNVSLPTDLLERAKELNVNVSRASERGLREEVEAAEARDFGPAIGTLKGEQDRISAALDRLLGAY